MTHEKEEIVKDDVSRRTFLGLLPAVLAAGVAVTGLPSGARGRHADARTGKGSWEHPEPRPDVDASGVLTADELADTPDVVEIYDGIREIPHVADGIRCHCGCAELPHTRSLLSCYEEGGMARYCAICQGEGRLAHRRWREGQSLEQIRRAVDARYGPRSGRPDADPFPLPL